LLNFSENDQTACYSISCKYSKQTHYTHKAPKQTRYTKNCSVDLCCSIKLN